MTTTIDTMTDEETIQDLLDRDVAADYEFTAAAGADDGSITAWDLGTRGIAIMDGTNGWTNYNIVGGTIADLDPLEILSEEGDPLTVGTILGIEAVDAAKADDAGPFKILASRDYYGPTSECRYESDPDTGQDLEFGTLAEAQAWIDSQSGPVYLSHNQAGGPNYKIVSD